MEHAKLFKEMEASVVNGKRESSSELAQQALEWGISAFEALEGFTSGIHIVGEKYENGEIFLPELVMAGDAMKAAMEILEKDIREKGTGRKSLGKVVIGTVKGDTHDIGKTIVASMLSANGFEVFDLGVDVSAEEFLSKVKEEDASLLGMSALLTTTMPYQAKVIEALNESGMRDKVKVIVGGAPASETWAAQIEADGYGANVFDALHLAKKLLT